MSIINARSLFPKIKSFARQFKEMKTDVSIITEIWGKASKDELQQIKYLLEMKGIDFIFDIRKGQRGGGTAIAINAEHFSITRISLPREKGLEVTAAMVKNVGNNNSNCRPLIIFSVYSSPKSKYKTELIDFLIMHIWVN